MDTTNKPVAWMYRIKDTDNRWEFTWNKPTTEELFDSEPLYTHPVKELTDEEMDLVRTVLDGCVSSIKTEIQQELQTFKGYEHCSNLPSLESELKDAEKAMEILRKAQEK